MTVLALAAPTFAEVGINASVNTNASVTTGAANVGMRADANASANKGEQRIQNGQNRGDAEVKARISSLNKLLARINAMKNLSDSQKASFSAEIQANITDMTNLQAKINADTSTTSLKADLQSITADYRIYALVMPQLSLLSAVDRANTLVTSFQAIQAKIQARIAADSSLSSNTTLSSDLADMTAKLADAVSVSAAAQAEITGLKPDQGDKTVAAANAAALKDARTKIQAVQKDLVAARKDAGDAVKLIVGSDKKLNAMGSASTTVSH
jgi:DNA repair exonuclease SbcCD ATPase subunit